MEKVWFTVKHRIFAGRGEGAREFTEGLSWLLRRVKRTPGSEDDPTDDNNDLSSHANETFSEPLQLI